MSSFDESSRPDFINLKKYLTDESKGGKFTKNQNMHKYSDVESVNSVINFVDHETLQHSCRRIRFYEIKFLT